MAVFADFLSNWELDNGKSPKLMGWWWNKDNGFAGMWTFPPDEKPAVIIFTHLLSKRHGAGARSRFTGLDGAARVFGRDDVGTALESEFVTVLRQHLLQELRKHSKPFVLDHVLGRCGQFDGHFDRYCDSVLFGVCRDFPNQCKLLKRELCKKFPDFANVVFCQTTR